LTRPDARESQSRFDIRSRLPFASWTIVVFARHPRTIARKKARPALAFVAPMHTLAPWRVAWQANDE